MSDTDDPVIKVIDVHLNRVPKLSDTTLESCLYLLQYPLRSVNRPYGDQGRRANVKYRPDNKTLRFEYDLNVSTDDSEKSTKQVLVSDASPIESCSYSLGLRNNDVLHIIPVQSLLQFRVDYNNNNGQVPTVETPNEENFDDTKKDIEHIKYRPSRYRDIVMSKPWIPIDSFYDMDSPESFEVIDLLTQINSTNLPKLTFSNDQNSYIDSLCNINNKKYISNTFALSQMSLEQQILHIIRNNQIEKTNNIMKSLVFDDTSESKIVSILATYAHLIRGIWICKSNLVHDGIAALCRDVIIFLLINRKPIVRETLIPYMGNLALETLTSMLKVLAVYKNNAWHLKFDDDIEIMQQYVDYVRDSNEYFSKANIAATIEKIKAISATQNSLQMDGDNAKIKEGIGINFVDAATFNKALLDSLSQGCDKVSVLLQRVYNSLCQQAQCLQASSQRLIKSTAAEITEKELISYLPRVGEELGLGYWVLRHTGNEQVDRHRAVIIDIFKEHINEYDEKKPKPRIMKKEIEMKFTKVGKITCLFVHLREFAVNERGYWIFKGFKDT